MAAAQQVIVVTGASSGFGRLTAVSLARAGHAVLGPAEAFTPEDLAAVYDVNVLGTQRVNRAALPHLRTQGSGLLVRVGSSSTRGDGSEVVSIVGDRIRADSYQRAGVEDLLPSTASV